MSQQEKAKIQKDIIEQVEVLKDNLDDFVRNSDKLIRIGSVTAGIRARKNATVIRETAAYLKKSIMPKNLPVSKLRITKKRVSPKSIKNVGNGK